MDDLEKRRWFLGNIQLQKNDNIWKFVRSGMLDILPYMPKLEITSKGPRTDFTFADFDLLIINNRIASHFISNQVQIFPIQLINDLNPKENEYSILTVVNEIDCIDREQSKFDVYNDNDEIRPDLAGQFKTVYTLKINKEIVCGLDIFRIKKYGIAIIVSESLKNFLEQCNVSGIKFLEV